MSENLNQLLHRASDLPGGPAPSPLAEIVRKAHTRRRRQRVATASCAAAAVAVAVVVPTALSRNPDGTGPVTPSPTGYPPTGYPTTGPSTAAALAHGHWSVAVGSPVLSRTGFASVWTGRQVLLWGGEVDNGAFADGASYDPAANSWQPIPRAPIAGRSGAAAVWTGTRLFVWGGGAGSITYQDGALYDPATRTWRHLPPAPLAARSGAQALWNGRQVVVLGGGTQTPEGALHQVAAYDPAAGGWTSLPAIGQRPEDSGSTSTSTIYRVSAIQAGDQLFAWVGWLTQHTNPDGSGSGSGPVDVLRYDPGAAGWVRVPPGGPELRQVVGPLLWTGQEVIIPATDPFCPGLPCPPPLASSLRGSRFDPRGNGWRVIDHGPADTPDGPAVWTGAALLRLGAVFDPGFGAGPPFGAAWDPAAQRWYRIPDAPTRADPAVTVWAGDKLVVLGMSSSRLGHAPAPVVLWFHP